MRAIAITIPIAIVASIRAAIVASIRAPYAEQKYNTWAMLDKSITELLPALLPETFREPRPHTSLLTTPMPTPYMTNTAGFFKRHVYTCAHM